MNDRDELLSLILDMLQRAGNRKIRFIYVLLRAMLGEGETA